MSLTIFFFLGYFYRSLWRVWIGALRTSANWTWYVEILLRTYIQQPLYVASPYSNQGTNKDTRENKGDIEEPFNCQIQNRTFRSKNILLL